MEKFKVRIDKISYGDKPFGEQMAIQNRLMKMAGQEKTLIELVEKIKKGHSFYTCDKKDGSEIVKRDAELITRLIGIDVDNMETDGDNGKPYSPENQWTPQIMIDKIEKDFGATPAIFYNSFRHKMIKDGIEVIKFRLIYVFEDELGVKDFKDFYNCLIAKYNSNEPRIDTTSNINRLWYGTNKTVRFNEAYKPITREVVQSKIREYRDRKPNSGTVKKKGRPNKGEEPIKAFAEGSRNNNLMKFLSGKINEPSLRTKNNMMMFAAGANMMLCNPPLQHEEVELIVNSILNAYTPPDFVTEKGRVSSNKLMKYYSDINKYNYYMGGDFIYNDDYYVKIADKSEIQSKLADIIEGYNESLVTSATLEETLKLLRIRNWVDNKSNDEFLNFNNGLFNISSNELKPHTPEVFTTFKIPCNFEGIEKGLEDFKGSRFEHFLKTTFKGDNEIIQNAKEILAMSLLPNPKKFSRLVLLSGTGSNGKSVFINILKALHGNSCSAVDLKSIDQKSNQNFDLYNMVGKKLNIDDDATGARFEDTGNLKKITGGGSVMLVKKNEQGISDVLNVLMVCAINNLPSTVDKSEGFFRRFLLLPFNQRFYKQGDLNINYDKDLPVDFSLESDIIEKEMNIVVSVAVDCLKTVIANNYQPTDCEAVREAILGYRKSVDSVFDFVEANKDGEFENDITSKDLFRYYVEWCEENNHQPCIINSFGKEMKKYYECKRRGKGMTYAGVRTFTAVERDFGGLYNKKYEEKPPF